MNRTLVALLALSLGANVFLGGFVAGRQFGGPGRHGGHGAHGPLGFDLAVLDGSDRKAFHEKFAAERAALRERMRAVHLARRAFGEALAADPFDRAAAQSALEALRAAEGERENAFGALLIDAFETLPVEDRRALVAAQTERRKMRRQLLRGGEEPPPEAPAPPG